MTLFEALPKDGEGQIEIPIGAVLSDGIHLPGSVNPDWLNSAFSSHINLTVPMSEADYKTLLSTSSDNWKLNWQAFRTQGII